MFKQASTKLNTGLSFRSVSGTIEELQVVDDRVKVQSQCKPLLLKLKSSGL